MLSSTRSARTRILAILVGLVAVLTLTGCGTTDDATQASTTSQAVPTTPAPPPTSTTTSTPPDDLVCTEPTAEEVVLEDTSELDNPGKDPAQHPEDGTYAAFDVRDGPESDYAPCFVAADDADLDDLELVIGLALGDEIRAYGVTNLIARPVNDRIDDSYLLVTY